LKIDPYSAYACDKNYVRNKKGDIFFLLSWKTVLGRQKWWKG